MNAQIWWWHFLSNDIYLQSYKQQIQTEIIQPPLTRSMRYLSEGECTANLIQWVVVVERGPCPNLWKGCVSRVLQDFIKGLNWLTGGNLDGFLGFWPKLVEIDHDRVLLSIWWNKVVLHPGLLLDGYVLPSMGV